MNLFAELVAAQAAMDHHAESRLLFQIAPKRVTAGCQHAKVPLHTRLLEGVVFGATECWHWVRRRNRFGYGQLTYQGRNAMAHRLSYQVFVGAIPSDRYVLHTCGNPSCINPEHLWLGTYKDNRQDCLKKGRWRLKRNRKGLAHPMCVAFPGDLDRIADLRRYQLSYKVIGEQIGLNAMTVWHAHNRWRKS